MLKAWEGIVFIGNEENAKADIRKWLERNGQKDEEVKITVPISMSMAFTLGLPYRPEQGTYNKTEFVDNVYKQGCEAEEEAARKAARGRSGEV